MRKMLTLVVAMVAIVFTTEFNQAMALADPATLTLGVGNYMVKQITTKTIKRKLKTTIEVVGQVYVETDPDDPTLMHQYWVLYGNYKGAKPTKDTVINVVKFNSSIASLDDFVTDVQDTFDSNSTYFESDVSVSSDLPQPSQDNSGSSSSDPAV